MLLVPDAHLFFTQEAALLLQPSQQPPKLSHDLAIARPVRLALANNDGEIEDELVPAVSPLSYAHRVANNAVVVDTEGEQAVAELLCWYEVLRYRGEAEERRGKC
jgi:hypothetical protein